MSLRPYAVAPGRRAAQVLADVLVLAWACACVLIGRAVHDAISQLSRPGLQLQSGAGGLAEQLRSAGRAAQEVPVVGDELGGPLDDAGGSVDQLADAGGSLAASLQDLADVVSVVVALLLLLLVVAMWLPMRLRFALRAGRVHRLATGPGGTDLLALRALAFQPPAALARISPDPVGDWRRGDPGAVRRLAALELRAAGVAAPLTQPPVPAPPVPGRAQG
ncbi:hypothetical protein [Quadrisphaera sp. DSM 44207]|uniref:hypothetical protein n=1 Tax=Quadrisphaera sp. DSM 44207 TaxID=1881057 RepID=UPI00115F8009|nr:hypothetical protein [Quadrisphaera sp. DSM 44207]